MIGIEAQNHCLCSNDCRLLYRKKKENFRAHNDISHFMNNPIFGKYVWFCINPIFRISSEIAIFDGNVLKHLCVFSVHDACFSAMYYVSVSFSCKNAVRSNKFWKCLNPVDGCSTTISNAQQKRNPITLICHVKKKNAHTSYTHTHAHIKYTHTMFLSRFSHAYLAGICTHTYVSWNKIAKI